MELDTLVACLVTIAGSDGMAYDDCACCDEACCADAMGVKCPGSTLARNDRPCSCAARDGAGGCCCCCCCIAGDVPSCHAAACGWCICVVVFYCRHTWLCDVLPPVHQSHHIPLSPSSPHPHHTRGALPGPLRPRVAPPCCPALPCRLLRRCPPSNPGDCRSPLCPDAVVRGDGPTRPNPVM